MPEMVAPPLDAKAAAKALGISYSQLREKRDELVQLGILVEALPRIDSRVRYLAGPINAYNAGAMRKTTLRAVIGNRL